MHAGALEKTDFVLVARYRLTKPFSIELGSINYGFTIMKQLEQLAWLKCTGTGRDWKFFKTAVWDLHTYTFETICEVAVT